MGDSRARAFVRNLCASADAGAGTTNALSQPGMPRTIHSRAPVSARRGRAAVLYGSRVMPDEHPKGRSRARQRTPAHPRPSHLAIVRRALVLVGLLVFVFGIVLPRLIDYDAVRAAFAALTPCQIALFVAAQHRRLRRQRWPFPRPRTSSLLASRGRIGPGRARGRQHRARADRLRHSSRSCIASGHSRRCRERRHRPRGPVRGVLLLCAAAHRHSRSARQAVNPPTRVPSCSR